MKSLAVILCFSFSAVYAQNVTVEVGGQPVGTRAALNLEPGLGVLQVCRDEGSVKNRVTCTPSFNSALVPTHDSVHNNENYCVSTNRTTQYACSLPDKAITIYQTGMTFVLVGGATCLRACSLNIDSLGPVNIKRSDGTTDPGGALIAGAPQWVFYDGRVFRLMGGGDARQADEGAGQHDSIARRFIAAMETVPYARTLTLETTAGDVHKTTTNNTVGNATIRAATAGLAGQHMWVIIVNDQLSAKTITFGDNLKSAGSLTGMPGKSATLQFISDGTVWYEVARTTNL